MTMNRFPEAAYAVIRPLVEMSCADVRRLYATLECGTNLLALHPSLKSYRSVANLLVYFAFHLQGAAQLEGMPFLWLEGL